MYFLLNFRRHNFTFKKSLTSFIRLDKGRLNYWNFIIKYRFTHKPNYKFLSRNNAISR